jgi:hypothetical protein
MYFLILNGCSDRDRSQLNSTLDDALYEEMQQNIYTEYTTGEKQATWANPVTASQSKVVVKEKVEVNGVSTTQVNTAVNFQIANSEKVALGMSEYLDSDNNLKRIDFTLPTNYDTLKDLAINNLNSVTVPKSISCNPYNGSINMIKTEEPELLRCDVGSAVMRVDTKREADSTTRTIEMSIAGHTISIKETYNKDNVPVVEYTYQNELISYSL